MDRINWLRKKTRIKNKLRKSGITFRLIIFRSNKHIYGQILDIEKGITLLSSSSIDNKLKKEIKSSKANKIEISKIIAKDLDVLRASFFIIRQIGKSFISGVI